MRPRTDLAQFLRSRRNRLRPDDVGLTASTRRRRVPGLRREELAQLAGVSTAYYIRLEQGSEANVSDSVLAALGRALRLSNAEQAHLVDLARDGSSARLPGQQGETSGHVRPGLQLMFDTLGCPAALLSRSTDVLRWNRLGHALMAPHLPFESPNRDGQRPNLSRSLFLDPQARRHYPDWALQAHRCVSWFWVITAKYPTDSSLVNLAANLCEESPEFAALWEAHPVRENLHATVLLDHPQVGRMELFVENLRLNEDGQLLVLSNPAPGSSSHLALQRLATLVEPSPDTSTRAEVGDGVAAPR